MSRRYSPNHPAVMSWQGPTRAQLNRPYRWPIIGMVAALIGGAVVPWVLPVIGIYGHPMPILWALPFAAVVFGCYARCEKLLEIERAADR